MSRYPEDSLGEYAEDNGTMPGSVSELEEAVVGHRIVSVESDVPITNDSYWTYPTGTVITLDNGRRVALAGTNDCCAYTELEEFLLHPELIDHIITGVGTTDGYTTWHIYADMGDVLELTVGWSCGNPFYYAYGFVITVTDNLPTEEISE